MIVTRESGIKTQGNLGGETKGMGVNLERLDHIMNVLTDLYSDQELAVIREYSTNALDAQIEAGYKGPIQVSLPTTLRQTFEVRDFGVGMSKQQILDVYGTYGTSTKTESNDFNGCLGLGSKSALTYTDMFIVKSNKDGKHVQAVIHRNDKGAGTIEVVDERDTDEPNGTTISIPTNARSDFETKALKFYSVWQPGTVEVVGRQIDFVVEKGLLLKTARGDEFYNVPAPSNYNHHDYVVMGNVAYPINKGGYGHRSSINYFFVEMGAVEFTPSRESLNMTDRTKKVVHNFQNINVTGHLTQHALSLIEKAKDMSEANKIWSEWIQRVGQTFTAKYKGIELKRFMRLDQDPARGYKGIDFIRPKTEKGEKNRTKVTRIDVDSADQYAYLVNLPGDKVISAKARAQMAEFLKDTNVNYVAREKFFTEKSNITMQFVEVDWEVIRKIDIKVERGVGKKKTPEYHFYQAGKGGRQYASLPQGATIVLCYDAPQASRLWSAAKNNEVFVYMVHTRLDKFKRENKFIEAEDFEKKIVDSLPEYDDYARTRVMIERSPWYGGVVKMYLNSTATFDEDLNKIREVKVGDALVLDKQYRVAGVDTSPSRDIVQAIDNKYPLADPNLKQHSLAYMKFVAEQAKKQTP